jgi:hypothetical protein
LRVPSYLVESLNASVDETPNPGCGSLFKTILAIVETAFLI